MLFNMMKDTMMPAAYFQKVRAHIIVNTTRVGKVIQNNNNIAQVTDETLRPRFHNCILYNTIRDINPRLTKHIQKHYKLKIAAGQRPTNLKSEIFAKIPYFIEEIPVLGECFVGKAYREKIKPIEIWMKRAEEQT